MIHNEITINAVTFASPPMSMLELRSGLKGIMGAWSDAAKLMVT